jgi:glycyl-tRNA synthetase alpha chain
MIKFRKDLHSQFIARHGISVTDRARFIRRVRSMSQKVAKAYYDSRKALDFPIK